MIKTALRVVFLCGLVIILIGLYFLITGKKEIFIVEQYRHGKTTDLFDWKKIILVGLIMLAIILWIQKELKKAGRL